MMLNGIVNADVNILPSLHTIIVREAIPEAFIIYFITEVSIIFITQWNYKRKDILQNMELTNREWQFLVAILSYV